MPNKKLLTIAVPAYNSAAFMNLCLDSLVHGGSDLEVLVVNDGSKDATLEVAKDYQRRFPEIVRPIDQDNRNWGGAVNHALKEATGTFFYIVDSDDWLSPSALANVMSQLRQLEASGERVDLFVVNYIYNRVCDGTRHVIDCRDLIPQDRVVGWDDLKKPKIDQYLMIHNMIYRTSVIRKSGLVLPEGESYMDSLVMLKPLRYVENLFYSNCDLYWYTIGREGQSIDTGVLKKHINEQLHATRLAIDGFDYAKLKEISPRLADCSLRYLSAMLTVSSIHLFQINTRESVRANRELWDYLRESDESLYKALRFTLCRAANRKTKLGRAAARTVYNISANVFKFA